MSIYNVLWIDDEIDKLSSFIIDAEYNDIYLTAFNTAQEGMNAFEENLMKWDGVILDAKCLNKSKDEVANIEGLYYSLSTIDKLKYKRNIPVFIYTGQPDLYGNEQFSMTLNGRKFYKKGSPKDKEQLFADIKAEADKLPETQIRHRFSDVMDLFTNEITGEEEILDIFMSLFGMKNINEKTYYTQLRVVLEWMFRDANRKGLLHDKCITKGKLNLTESNLFLSGSYTKYTGVYCKKAHFPKIISTNVRAILEITGGASHSAEPSKNDLYNLHKYWSEVNTPYLLYALTFMLSDILIWYSNYILTCNDIEENKSLWRNIDYSNTVKGKVINIDANGLAYLKSEDVEDDYVYLIDPKCCNCKNIKKKSKVTAEYNVEGETRTITKIIYTN